MRKCSQCLVLCFCFVCVLANPGNAQSQAGAPGYGGNEGRGFAAQTGNFAYPGTQFSGYSVYNSNYRNYGAPEYGAPSPYPYGSPMYGQAAANVSPYPSMFRGNVSCLPQGLQIPISLRTAISTQVAKSGDYIQAAIDQNVSAGGSGYLPAGSVVSGEITESQAGRRLSRSGSLSIQFNQLRLPSGVVEPINAHLVGQIGKYKEGADNEMHGEHWTGKLGQFALRGLLGAGLGAGLGTGIGAIAGGGTGAGMGAWSGAAVGGGIGGLDMLLRKGRDVIIPSGTKMELQLDQPINLPGPTYAGAPPSFYGTQYNAPVPSQEQAPTTSGPL